MHRACHARASSGHGGLTVASSAWTPYATRVEAVKADPDFASAMTPSWTEILLVLATMLSYGITAAYGDEMTLAGNWIGPSILSVSLVFGGYRLLRAHVRNLWVPLLWYRISMFIYYGVGTVVPLFVNAETTDVIMNFYSFNARDMLKLNVVTCLFHLVVLVVVRGLFAGLSRKTTVVKTRERLVKLISPANFSVGVCGTVFLGIGAAANFLIILPATLGWIDTSSLGPLNNIALASLIGDFLLTYWALENRRSAVLAVVLIFVVLETLLGLLQMTKFVTLFPAAMVGLGFIYHRPTLFRILSFGAALFAIFMFLTPLIGYARNTNNSDYQGSASPSDVLRIYLSYNGRDTENDASANYQDGWARLSYVSAGTFAINQYDRGEPGDTYRYALIVMIPRALYPNKPIITDISREFTYAVNGNYDSSTNPGLPSEAYYNFGWTGVLLVALLTGLIIGFWSIYSYTALQRDAWHLFFVVLLGLKLGSRMDGALVSDIIGAASIGLLAHITLEFLNRFLPQRVPASRRWSNLPEPAG